MKVFYKLNFLLLIIIAIGICGSCVKNDDFGIPEAVCPDDISANKTITDIISIATETPVKYIEEDVIEGYVVSSDQSGNFFKSISIQTLDGSIGFSIPIDLTDLYTVYNPGRKVIVKLLNSYTQIDDDALEIGHLFIDNFGNESVGRIANTAFEAIVIKSCETINEAELVNHITIDQIKDLHLHTLVELTGVQFEKVALGTNLYDTNNDTNGGTNHNILDNTGASIILRTSSFADFARMEVPNGNGTIRGVLTKFNGQYQIVPRSENGLNLTEERIRIGFAENITGTRVSIADVRALFMGSNTSITDDFFIEGAITLSGFDSNNISEHNAFIQDDSGAISLAFSVPSSVARNDKVKVGLKDVLLNEVNGLLEINVVQNEHVAFVEENAIPPVPVLITLPDLLSGDFQSQFVQLDSIQFENEIGTYSGNRRITDCTDAAVLATNTNSLFANETYPMGNGTLLGIATNFNNPQVVLRDTKDAEGLTGDRCIINTEPVTTVFFSELADPNNNSAARFIEIYNSGTRIIDLTGWTIRRYTNDNNTSTTSLDLSGNRIEPGQAFVIAAKATDFEIAFGFAPDLEAGTGSPADSNGDDNLELVDSNGNVVDTFGIPGEDGSGTNHEFEDGRALRNASISQGSPAYNINEWQLWNDTGDAGTINAPQDAPGNFTPGQR